MYLEALKITRFYQRVDSQGKKSYRRGGLTVGWEALAHRQKCENSGENNGQ